ncbi:MAG TPA: alpha/beta-type small acid-soluble spore protein [Firmicutes bacterium]|nr:alpha/beta-type small acid-soluble spore protein [Bacillota bacterium]
MARGQKTNRTLVREAAQALDQFKYQVASQIGVHPPADDYWGDIPARQCGAVGGQMVRSMIQLAEQSLAQGGALPTAGGAGSGQGGAGGGGIPNWARGAKSGEAMG